MGETLKRNLHLLWDEKITPGIIENFETILPGRNDYIFWWNPDFKLHFAKKDEKCKLIKNEGDVPELDYSKYSKVIIHGLDPRKADFCKKNIPSNIPIYWILWGIDLYQLVEPRGYKLLYHPEPSKSSIGWLKKIIKRFGYLSPQVKEYLSFFNQRDVTMIASKEEYEILRKYYPNQTKTLKNNPDFFYYPVEKILGKLAKQEARGKCILVGNSNSYTNNHSYVFKYIKHADLKDRIITVPLSYGGSEESRNRVIQEGQAIFGAQFNPLIDFLPLDKYNQIMMETEYAVYGNWRQEAVGNILIALYLGSKVFLSEKNPLIKIFGDMGLKIYILEKIDNLSFSIPLSSEFKEHNRRIIAERYSFSKMEENIKNLFT